MRYEKRKKHKQQAARGHAGKIVRKVCCAVMAAAYLPLVLMNGAKACTESRVQEEYPGTSGLVQPAGEECAAAQADEKQQENDTQPVQAESEKTQDTAEKEKPHAAQSAPDADSALLLENTQNNKTTDVQAPIPESGKTESEIEAQGMPQAETDPAEPKTDGPQEQIVENLPQAEERKASVYRVQYYANLPQYQATSEEPDRKALFIDTSAAANGGSPKLPKNGSELLKFWDVYLEPGVQGYRIPMEPVLQPIYKEQEYSFSQNKTAASVNRLEGMPYYQLRQIWRLKPGKAEDSMDIRDWDVFPPQASFSEKAQQAGSIQISSGTVLRLVYDTVKKEQGFENPVVFYDYDVTDGSPTPLSDGTHMLHTEHYGINSAENTSANEGARFAFGNDSMGTDFGNESWNGNQINRFNQQNQKNGGQANGANAACFGMVTGLDEQENPIFASGLNVPPLFGEKQAVGKTEITDKALVFRREGDTYLLTSVKGTDLEHLDKFQHTMGSPGLWTNEFWPLDASFAGADPMLGGPNNKKYKVPVNGGIEPPRSDLLSGKQEKDHNNYFGMHCAFEFEMTADYIGPMDFLVYGDDDVWMFLDDTLIADIGGVHCAAGMYVDLWDYIPKGTQGKHRINIFFTERGASGSTCYMQFTLPNVGIGKVPQKKTGMLQVEKEVRGGICEEIPFQFSLKLSNHEEKPLSGSYPYQVWNKDGTLASNGVFRPGENAFSLKHGQFMTVELPKNTKYTIQELLNETTPPCTTIMQINDKDVVYAKEYSGKIKQEKQTVVHVINQADSSLPSTGGTGKTTFLLWGIFLQTAALYSMKQRKCGSNRSIRENL